MPSVANVIVHASQFPENVRRDLLQSLHTRQIQHKFHYGSIRQTQKWLALHEACSPSRTDADCAAIYDRSFAAGAARVESPRVHLIGFGCGGGQKDTRLLKLLTGQGKEVFYTPCDVSTAMVLVARQTALSAISGKNCFPLVCDLLSAEDLPAVLDSHGAPDAARLISFFGMIPNFEPRVILQRLTNLVRPGDFLIFSANLAPGDDYTTGVRCILPQYENALTHDWLMTFLLDLGVQTSDGDLRFEIEKDPTGSGVKRVAGYFHFSRPRQIDVESERFAFRTGESVRLFFSYRYTPALVRSLLAQHNLQVLDQWITQSAEEGVFLVCQK